MTDNSPDAVLKRRTQDTLIIVGNGIIVFGLWTLIKTVGIFLMYRTELIRDIRALGELNSTDYSDSNIFIVMFITTLILLSFIILIRSYVGLSAISEGRGRQCSILYILITIIMIWLNSMSFIQLTINLIFGEEGERAAYSLSEDPSLSSAIIELTSIIMMIHMTRAAIRIRRLRKAEAGREA